MKRLFLLLSVVFGVAFFGNFLNAQEIYVYNVDKRIDSDGATVRAEGTRYFLFSGNRIFEVNQDGVKNKDLSGYTISYLYKNSKNGNNYYYKMTYEPVPNYTYFTIDYVEKENKYEYIIVNSDKSKMNIVTEPYVSYGIQMHGGTTVLSRTSREAVDKAKRDALPDMIE